MLPPGTITASVLALAGAGVGWPRRVKPRIHLGADAAPTMATVSACAGDKGYWPTPWLSVFGLGGGHLQTIWFGKGPKGDELLGRVTTETWRMPDGGTVGLAWPEAPPSLPASAPVTLLLPGLCGSVVGSGCTCSELLNAGIRPVVLHARGCGQRLTTACFNLFGRTDDVRECVKRIGAKYPDASVALYGVSAGTALLVRYLGEEGQRPAGERTVPRVYAGVADSPGYDIGVCLTRVAWLYDSAFYINVLKKHWLDGANGDLVRRLAPDAYERMRASRNMHDFMVAASPCADVEMVRSRERLASSAVYADSFAGFLAASNPMGVAEHIDVPVLVLNADDDPICATANTDENAELMLRQGCRKGVVLRLPTGGHCGFYAGLRARRWGDRLAANFLAQSA